MCVNVPSLIVYVFQGIEYSLETFFGFDVAGMYKFVVLLAILELVPMKKAS